MAADLAVITGASGGIGAVLAREHARRGGDLILVARSAAPMQALADELATAHDVRVAVHALDLAAPDAADRLTAWLAQEDFTPDILVNNAGFGGRGPFLEQDPDVTADMIRLNVATLTALTRHIAPGMVARGRGRILHVGSTAGFIPGPLQATYYATKAYVNSFSQALHEELRGTGVTSTLLCPGPVDTGFAARADAGHLRVFRAATTAQKTAAIGYRAMERGRRIAFVPRYFGVLRMAGLFPRGFVVRASRRAMET